jgi:heme A synthase
VWLLARRRASVLASGPLTVLGVLVAAQGLVGSVQYELHLPSDIVWVHVGLATASWLTLLWSVAAAGSLAPRRAAVAQPYSAELPSSPAPAAEPEPLVTGSPRR